MSTFDLGGGGNSFGFDQIGDSVTGQITVIEELQQTDMDTGQPAVWDSGQPKMMVRVELQTEQRDPSNPGDDGRRSVYLKGSRKPESKSSLAAVLVAVQQGTGGGRSIQTGGTLTLTYSGDGVPSRKGYNAPKQYEAVYAPPAVDLGGPPAQAPAPQAAPAPAPQAAPAAPQMTPEQAAAWAQYQAQQQTANA